LSEIIDVTPEPAAPPEFIDSAQSVDLLLATVLTPEAVAAGGTGMRLFAFKPEGTTERLALAFVGPEAEKLARMFVQYAEALFDHIESRRGEAA
jgi:hypothetical protein